MVATCEKSGDISESFSKLFREKVAVKLPEKGDRERVVKWLL